MRARTGLSAALGVWAAPALPACPANAANPAAPGGAAQPGAGAGAPASSAHADEQRAATQAGPPERRSRASNPPLEQLAATNAALFEARLSAGAAAGVSGLTESEVPEGSEQPAEHMHDDCGAGTAAQGDDADVPVNEGGDGGAPASAAGQSPGEERRQREEPLVDFAASKPAGLAAGGVPDEHEAQAGVTECNICYNAMDIAMVWRLPTA